MSQNEQPTEYYVAWEDTQDVGSLAWATRLARKRLREGKEGVQIRRRSGLRQEQTADGLARWTWDDDELEQDVFEQSRGED